MSCTASASGEDSSVTCELMLVLLYLDLCFPIEPLLDSVCFSWPMVCLGFLPCCFLSPYAHILQKYPRVAEMTCLLQMFINRKRI